MPSTRPELVAGACTCSHSKPWHSPKVAGRPCEKCACTHYADAGAMFEVVAELSVDVDGFDAWQAAQGMPATRNIDGIETIADFALAIEHSAHIAAGDGRLF